MKMNLKTNAKVNLTDSGG